jgi:hypothetical protein
MLIAPIIESEGDFPADLLMDLGRNAYAPRWSERLKPSRDVYPIAIKPLAVVYDITEVDANSELHQGLGLCVQLIHSRLNSNFGFYCSDGTLKFCKNAIPSQINDTPAEGRSSERAMGV